MMSVGAVVPAAGVGRRFGAKAGKLFVRVAGRPLLAHTLQALQRHPDVRWIVVAARPRDHRRISALIRRYRITKALPSVAGGASRAASVARGVRALPSEARWVLVHDGARPCVSPSIIARTIQAARRGGAALCGLPASQTVKLMNGHRIVRRTLPRERVWLAQTPQVFRRDRFERSLARAARRLAAFPDDASIVEASGFTVRMVLGEPGNVKVTTTADLAVAATILRRRKGVHEFTGSSVHWLAAENQ